MKSIIVHMKDGSKREFPHEGRPGGSYSKSVRYEGAFAIVVDEWYNERAIPVDLIREVEVINHQR